MVGRLTDKILEIAEQIFNGDIAQVSQPNNLGWFPWEDVRGETPAERIAVMVHCWNKGWDVRIKPKTQEPANAKG